MQDRSVNHQSIDGPTELNSTVNLKKFRKFVILNNFELFNKNSKFSGRPGTAISVSLVSPLSYLK